MTSLTAEIDGRRVTWEDGNLMGTADDVSLLKLEEVRAEREGVEVGHVMGPHLTRNFLTHELGFLALVGRLWPAAKIVWNTPEPSYSSLANAVS